MRRLPRRRGIEKRFLLLPGEQVDVLLRFEAHVRRFLLHCHNLEHEDGGMMLSFDVG